ncbi:DRC2 protein, partial [Centropus bengalensis]|nr:DRC2 protein [Centropus bengalensis]
TPVKQRQQEEAPTAAMNDLLLLQKEALAKEEEAKMRGELLTRFLKNKLAREEQASTLNLQKIHTRWWVLLREAKAQELRRDIAILSQTFGRVMDCKDSVIEARAQGLAWTGGRGDTTPGSVCDIPHCSTAPQTLVTDLEQAERQRARALRSHLDNVDRLLQLQRGRLAYLEEGYNTQLSILEREFEAERY